MTNEERLQELAELLARLVADGALNEEQAQTIYLAVLDAGVVLLEALPLPLALGVYGQAEPDEDEIAKLLLVITGISILAPGRGRALGERRRTDAAGMLQDWHTAEARSIAQRLAGRALSVSEFQGRLLELNTQHNAAQAMLGAGPRWREFSPRAAEMAALQAAYLQRFADEVAGRRLGEAAGLPHLPPGFSAEYLAERAAQYGGIGRAVYFMSYEALGLPQTADGAPGVVIRYVAVDDAGTCSPCHNAQGYYLPGQGPYPGQVCLGRHHCRCRRETLYDPTMYFSLLGAGLP